MPRHRNRAIWLALALLVASAGAYALGGCAFPGSVKPTVKIGLTAPFEGRYRDLGYEVLHSVRLAVRQHNEAGGVDGRYWVEFVALNDFDEPAQTIVQARKMGVDAGVLGVLGGWSPGTAGAAQPEYERLGLAFLTPGVDFTDPLQPALPGTEPDAGFEAAYQAQSGGAPPGPAAWWAYAQANRLLDALDAAARDGGAPTRPAVRAELAR